MTNQDPLNYYDKARSYVLATQYRREVEWCETRPPLETLDGYDFFCEYVWVVLSAGMQSQVAEKIFHRYLENIGNPEKAINHLKKRDAVESAILNYPIWLKTVKSLKTDAERVEYLDTLPFIGKITKFHLARNIGIECVKPDIWLVRVAKHFGYPTPLDLCEYIKKSIGENLGVIDVVIWRYCNLTRDYGAGRGRGADKPSKKTTQTEVSSFATALI